MIFSPGVDLSITPQACPINRIIAVLDSQIVFLSRIDGAVELDTLLPSFNDIAKLEPFIRACIFLGRTDTSPVFAIELDANAKQVIDDSRQLYSASLRSQLDILDDSIFHLCGSAQQVIQWNLTHKFCGACGTSTVASASDRARECPSCAQAYYPRISPCVIGLIQRGDECLLAHHTKFQSERYSVLAGFIEPGESAEQAFEREVKEEVNLEIDNIRFYKSQPWPFPGQLMIGFIADYKSGEITVDGIEIDHANWFRPKNFPELPPLGTISRQLIDDFVARVAIKS